MASLSLNSTSRPSIDFYRKAYQKSMPKEYIHIEYTEMWYVAWLSRFRYTTTYSSFNQKRKGSIVEIKHIKIAIFQAIK